MSLSKCRTVSNPTEKQMDYMVNYMFINPLQANNEGDSLDGWISLACDLNSIEGGCQKQPRGWMKTWADLVGAARQNLNYLLEGVRQMPLTPNHVKVLQIMGQEAPDMEFAPGQQPLPAAANANPPPALAVAAANPQPMEYAADAGTRGHAQAGLVAAVAPRPRASNANPRARPSQSRRQTFCGFEQLLQRIPGNSTAGPSNRNLKKAKMDLPISSTSGNAEEKTSKLMNSIETMTSEFLTRIMRNVQEALELQTCMIQSSLENHHRTFLDNLPIIHQEINEIREILVNNGRENVHMEEENAAVDGVGADYQDVPDEADDDQGIDLDVCPICQEDYDNKKTLPCKHTYCAKCIRTWFSTNNTCPICRRQIKDAILYVNDLITFVISDSEDD